MKLTKNQWLILAVSVAVVVVAAIVWKVRRTAARPSGAAPAMADMPGMTTPPAGTVQLTTAQLRQFGVTFGSVETRTLTSELRVPGTVVVDETRVVQVALKFGGYVERLYANVTGQSVREGQPLMEVYSPDVFAAMQELLVATHLDASGSATDLVAAARQRLSLLGVAPQEIDDAVRRNAAPRTVTVYSSSSGVVTERMVTQGQSLQAGQTLYTIASLSGVWVNADVRETDAALLRTGLGADVELASMPGRPFKGMVTYVYPTLNAGTRTLTARVAVANEGGQLRPGMFATVHLLSAGRRTLTIPTSAVVQTGARTLAFVDLGGGRIEPKEIAIGQKTSDYTEVLTGLATGQRVVTSAQYLLDSESNLAEVMRSMIGQGGGASDTKNATSMPGMDMGGQPTDKGARVKP